MKIGANLFLLFISVLLLAGCQSEPVRDISYAPARPIALPAAPEGNGSIYQSSRTTAPTGWEICSR
jgi:hypothetical protein